MPAMLAPFMPEAKTEPYLYVPLPCLIEWQIFHLVQIVPLSWDLNH